MINKIVKPTLVLNKKIALNNIKKQIQVSRKNNIILRPHFKTHQSLEIGSWFKSLGIKKITVSSLKMAKYFSAQWDDITVAFPVNIREIKTINTLLSSINLNLLLESVFVLKFLEKNLTNKANVLLKLDAGYGRSGINIENLEEINQIIEYSKKMKNISLSGFLIHNGHTYSSRSIDDILFIHSKSMKKINFFHQKIVDNSNYVISIGDTPSCSVINNYGKAIHEIRPGNFVFYDLAQWQIGSCKIEDIAIRMVCPVVSIHSDRNEAVIYGGAIHFSKDFIKINKNKVFGYVYSSGSDIWSDNKSIGYLKSVSQEHGIVKFYKIPESLHEGNLLSIIPVHSCLNANLMKKYLTDDGKIIEMMKD